MGAPAASAGRAPASASRHQASRISPASGSRTRAATPPALVSEGGERVQVRTQPLRREQSREPQVALVLARELAAMDVGLGERVRAHATAISSAATRRPSSTSTL